MAGYENTHLWQSSFGKKLDEDINVKNRDFYRVNLESFRIKAAILAAEINRSLPQYTVHDISHIDSLWEMASLICGSDYYLNPAEAFVLGAAFLIHDLGMGLAAYPQGLETLRDTTIWKDTFAHVSLDHDSEENEKQVLEIVLRSLHAKHAETLAFASWGEGEEKEYLIDNSLLREDYGAVIGKIAHSHWWDSSELLSKFPYKLGASGNMPNTWEVDALKLACIMRVSDASHIDSRRAPSFLKKVRELSKYSESHWRFQQKLYQPRIETDKLVYTSKSAFKIEEANSWWLCLDTIKMIDRELYLVDSILHSNNRNRFEAKGVAGVDHLRAVERLIPTEGWEPVDAKLHVGNISSLVENLGGSQLYGDNIFVPLRELIQNGCDAIRARRVLEGYDDNYGKVTIRLDEDDKGFYLEVEDDGVGMSTNVLSGPFLDFGTSFWNTTLMHEELPGLASKGYTSTGKFGVGFFSVFMWGGDVDVITRRFEDARQDTKVLSFDRNYISRPLIRNASESEYIRTGGTRIRVYFGDDMDISQIFRRNYSYFFEDLVTCISINFPSSDVTLYVEDNLNEVSGVAITANDWLTLDEKKFVSRIIDLDNLIENHEISDEELNYIYECSKYISLIEDDGRIVGRGFITPDFINSRISSSINHGKGVITVGGYRTDIIYNFIGILIGTTGKASRDESFPLVNKNVFKKWIASQTSLLKDTINEEGERSLAEMFATASIEIGDLRFAKINNGYINFNELKNFLDCNEVIYIINPIDLHMMADRFDDMIVLKDNVLVLNTGHNSFLRNQNDYISYLDYWPGDEPENSNDYTLIRKVFGLIEKCWDISFSTFYEHSNPLSALRERVPVGSFQGVDFTMKSYVIDKNKLKNINQ